MLGGLRILSPVLLLLVLSSGCLSSAPPARPDEASARSSDAPLQTPAAARVDSAPADAPCEDCGATAESPHEVVYEDCRFYVHYSEVEPERLGTLLPAPYAAATARHSDSDGAPTTAGVSLAVYDCDGFVVDGARRQPGARFAFAYAAVAAPDEVSGLERDTYMLEIMTSDDAAADLWSGLGFPVRAAAISFADEAADAGNLTAVEVWVHDKLRYRFEDPQEAPAPDYALPDRRLSTRAHRLSPSSASALWIDDEPQEEAQRVSPQPSELEARDGPLSGLAGDDGRLAGMAVSMKARGSLTFGSGDVSRSQETPRQGPDGQIVAPEPSPGGEKQQSP